MTTLAGYITQVRQLVHDLQDTDYTDDELTGYINEGRINVALDCHCVRQLYTAMNLIANQETYPFTGAVGGIVVTAGGTLYTSAPTVVFTGGSPTTAATATAVVTSGAVSSVYMTSWGAGYQSAPAISFSGGGGSGATATATTLLNTLDVLSVNMQWAAWKTLLQKRVFTWFQAWCRANPTLRGPPSIWSIYREQTLIYYCQIPDSSNTYQVEYDCVRLPDALASGDSDAQIIAPYDSAVKYYAAYLAISKLQTPEMARMWLNRYQERIKQIIQTRRGPWITSAYSQPW
ncbi:MAG: hypothetical protein KGL39_12440 [Patescibacteria group bacterium]|nr:hypothetical protein [Patescibacteria group bacterium]